MPSISRSRRARRVPSAVGHDRALDASESLQAVRAWDEYRIAALARAYLAMGRPAPLPPNWRAALTSLEHLAEALALAETAATERAEVAETFAHVFLSGIAAGVRERLRP